MKSKILSKLFLVVSLGIIYTTMSSDDNGRAENGTNCGSCHGSKTTATTTTLTGLPSTYVSGQTYTLTLTVANATNSKAGCNIAATAGTLAAGTGTKIKGGQITHISPTSAVSGTTTFTCLWTAPTGTAAVTFNAVGNAVNGNGNDDTGDQWNTISAPIIVSGGIPSSINDINTNGVVCYPNPTTNFIIAEGIGNNAKNITLYNVYGQMIKPFYTIDGSNCQINCQNLVSGIYILSAEVDGKKLSTSFVKN